MEVADLDLRSSLLVMSLIVVARMKFVCLFVDFQCSRQNERPRVVGGHRRTAFSSCLKFLGIFFSNSRLSRFLGSGLWWCGLSSCGCLCCSTSGFRFPPTGGLHKGGLAGQRIPIPWAATSKTTTTARSDGTRRSTVVVFLLLLKYCSAEPTRSRRRRRRLWFQQQRQPLAASPAVRAELYCVAAAVFFLEVQFAASREGRRWRPPLRL